MPFQTLFHTPRIALSTLLIVLRTALIRFDTALTMPFQMPLRKPLIAFQIPFHHDETAEQTDLMTLLTALTF